MNNKRHSAIFWAIVVVLALASRFATVGLQSPWLDEVMNWQTAEAYGLGLHIKSAHPLTYLFQSIGLMMSDSAAGLRLYSALFGVLAGIAGVAYARRIGTAHGIAAAIVLLCSPFLCFYSQDANHYAPIMLSGILAAFGVDWMLARERPRFLLFGTSLLLCLAFAGFHPMALIPAGAMGLVAIAWLVVHADIIPPRKLNVRTKRLLIILAACVAALIVLPSQIRQLSGAEAFVPTYKRKLGLEWEPWRALLGDFFGALFHHQWPDTVLGIAGTIASIAGFVLIARRKPWCAAGAAAVVIAAFLPFLLFDFSHYFAPRYLTAAVPVLLLGVAFATAELWTRKRTAVTNAALIACLVWLAFFCVRSSMWQIKRGVAHQRTYEAMAFIRDQTPDDSIIVTKHRYSSRVMNFLWNRYDMGGRRFVPVDHVHWLPAPSMQQIEELTAANEANVYFTTFINDELYSEPEFAQWLEQNSTVIADFPSGSPDEYIPFDWGVTIRLMNEPKEEPLSIPRPSVEASALAGSERILAAGSLSPQLRLVRGTGASWNLELDRPVDGIMLRATKGKQGSPTDLWIVGGVRGGALTSWYIEKDASNNLLLAYPFSLEVGTHTFDFYITRPGMAFQGFANELSVDIARIEPWDREESPARVLLGNELVAMDAGELPRKRYEVTPSSPDVLDEYNVDIPAAGNQNIFIVQYINIRGLGDRGISGRVRAGNSRAVMPPPTEFTHGWVMTAGVVQGGTTPLEFRIVAADGSGRRLYKPIAELDPPMILVEKPAAR